MVTETWGSSKALGQHPEHLSRPQWTFRGAVTALSPQHTPVVKTRSSRPFHHIDILTLFSSHTEEAGGEREVGHTVFLILPILTWGSAVQFTMASKPFLLEKQRTTNFCYICVFCLQNKETELSLTVRVVSTAWFLTISETSLYASREINPLWQHPKGF